MINFKNLTKKYKGSEIVALDSFTLDVNDYEIICLLGPNGAGKTTLIKALTGLVIPDNGEIYIDDKKINTEKINYLKDIAVVLEGARNLYWRISVKSNFYYFGALKGISRKQIDSNIKKYNELFNINDLLNRRVNTLSLGQKQKVAIIANILLTPKILVLDEPSNGLDIEAKEMLLNLLNIIKKQNNTTVLIASHDVDFIRRAVDRIAILNNGKVQEILVNDNISNSLIEEKYLKIVSA
ncbi:ABC transporter ATP-binding protein [Clostridium estertheticum]|uniref:ABC transporter ATP-binding protein n=1 Tax=Clostridium estertheticum TaxID=238834 RepID=A0AA47EH73_9CLOT|nr:ABC transporter ATP-binding protein [Clostridium estertheticum]MBU3156454.1 ABC transporter ATP-binding protein [Clostridium estertheticum]MBU3199866.1 ABC transporter ATP-binding protein [Clostridium estertheticum]WAG58911.1 ABC transporter ATP-binding protein [Clostridium estertheticum]WAG67034.1 ABC transporter ATP-binding protein [Clostridium estertheticum]